MRAWGILVTWPVLLSCTQNKENSQWVPQRLLANCQRQGKQFPGLSRLRVLPEHRPSVPDTFLLSASLHMTRSSVTKPPLSTPGGSA